VGIRTIPVVVALLLGVAVVEAAPVSVRLPEGNTRGFLVLRFPDGTVIAHGELRQKPAQELIENRLFLAFTPPWETRGRARRDDSSRGARPVLGKDDDLLATHGRRPGLPQIRRRDVLERPALADRDDDARVA
jgi:hypothetical protein